MLRLKRLVRQMFAKASDEPLQPEFPIGNHTYGYEQFCIPGINLEKIGAFCSLGPNISIVRNHTLSGISTHPFFFRHLPRMNLDFVSEDKIPADLLADGKVAIGNDVWIGCNVIVLPSVVIGNGAVVGAGSVVTKGIPDYAVVAGVPARVIRYRFEPEQIELLNRIKWWDWPDERIKAKLNLFAEPDRFFEVFADENV